MKVTLLSISILCFLSSFGQMKKSVEISILARHDQHADYVSNFGGRAYNDTNKLYGISYGINIGFRQRVSKSIFAYFSVGYYRLRIDKIKGSMPFNAPGVRAARNIINVDDDSTRLGYGTDKYHYNNLFLTIGLSKIFPLK